MFYNKADMGCIIKGVYRINGEAKRVCESGRTHTAISYRIKGNTVIYCSDNRLELADGTVAFFPSGVDYLRETLENEEYIVIHLETFGKSEDTVEAVDSCEEIRPLFETVLSEWEKGEDRVYSRCVRLLYEIFEAICAKENKPKKAPEVIAAGVAYMNESFRDSTLTVAAMADKCHISEAYFRRIFGSFFGRSPIYILQELRFNCAKDLLRSGYYSTKEVAVMSGFSDVKYFRTAFKKRYGITVGDFLHGTF